MVVVASPNYSLPQPPLVVRIRNATGNSFEARLQRIDGLNLPVGGVNLHYMVAEEGVYTESQHGIKMEALKFPSDITNHRRNWKAVERPYQNNYLEPVVLGQVMTSNDTAFSVFFAYANTRQNPPSSAMLSVGKHVAEDPNTTRAVETIGYIVLESGSGTIGTHQYIAGVTADEVTGVGDNPPVLHSLPGAASMSAAIVSSAGMDGNEGGWPVLYGPNPLSEDSLHLAIDEDQYRDSERQHTAEQVAYIVLR